MAIICIAAQVYAYLTIYFLLNVEEKFLGQRILINILLCFYSGALGSQIWAKAMVAF